MYLNVPGLVLRMTAYNDTDALLTVLTPDHGKMTVKARGLRRKNSPLAAPCQLFAYNEFVLFEYRGMYTINEVHCVEQFQPLRNDLEKLYLATYFAQVAEVLAQEDMPSKELLSLLLNSLHALSKLNLPNEQIKAVYELRCACISGYMPDLAGCWACNGTTAAYFDLSNGRLECSSCMQCEASGIRLPITSGVLDSMRYVCYCDSKRLFSFSASDETIKQLSQLSEAYLSTQLERGFSCLDLYKSLII